MAFIPYRAFIKNLLYCCESSCEELGESLNDQVIHDIKYYYKNVEEILSSIPSDQNAETILPKSFHSFVQQMSAWRSKYEQAMKKKTKPPATPHYCLFEHLQKIKETERFLTTNKGMHSTVSDSDLDTFKQFTANFNFFHDKVGAEAVSVKSLERLMAINKNCYENPGDMKDLRTGPQEKLVDYLLMNVFSKMDIQTKINPYKSQGWYNFIFSDLSSTVISINLQVNNEQGQERLNLFFRRLLRKSQNQETIGKTLVDIRKEISTLYKGGLLVPSVADSILDSNSSQNNVMWLSL